MYTPDEIVCVADLDESATAAPTEASDQADGEASAEAVAAEEAAFLRKEGESPGEYAARIFDRVYHQDIERVLGMKVGLGFRS
jgi:hypothetical protein